MTYKGLCVISGVVSQRNQTHMEIDRGRGRPEKKEAKDQRDTNLNDHPHPSDGSMGSEIDDVLLSPDDIKVINILRNWMGDLDSRDLPDSEVYLERTIAVIRHHINIHLSAKIDQQAL